MLSQAVCVLPWFCPAAPAFAKQVLQPGLSGPEATPEDPQLGPPALLQTHTAAAGADVHAAPVQGAAAEAPTGDRLQDRAQHQQPQQRQESAGVGPASAAAVSGGTAAASGSTASRSQGGKDSRAALKSAAGRAGAEARWGKYRAERSTADGAGDVDMTDAVQIELQQQEGMTPAMLAAAPPAQAEPLAPPAAADTQAVGTAVAVGGDVGAASASRSQGAQLQWEKLQQQLALQGSDVPVDAGVINNAVLSVSDALQLPDDLLAGLSNSLMQSLQGRGDYSAAAGDGTAPATGVMMGVDRTSVGDGGVEVGGSEQQQREGAAGQLPGAVRAAMQGWYQRLCGAVAARDGQQVAQLVRQLGQEVLVAGQ